MRLLLRIRLPYFVLAIFEELNVCIRGCFLLLLFMPAVVTAHFSFWAGGEHRKRWMQLIIWTLHQVCAWMRECMCICVGCMWAR